MRSTYPHLPNPKLFVPAEHAKRSYWQQVRRDLQEPGVLAAIAFTILGFAISASLH